MPACADRLSGFTESVIREMTREAIQHGSLNLAQGFPDFDPPAELVEALARAIREPCHQYAVTWGAPRFRQALADKITRFTRQPVDPDRHLVVTCGSTEAMMVAVMTACNPGDRVVVFSPFYENYAADAILCGAVPVHVPLTPPAFRWDPQDLAAAFRRQPKAVILCNPANPSGRVFTPAELDELGRHCAAADAFLIVDEVYEHIVYPPHRHTYACALPGLWERTITCGSLSKTYAITGWRLGYVLADAPVIAAARKVHDFLTVGAAAPLQEAALTALRFGDDYYRDLTESYARKRDFFLGALRQAGLAATEPEGAYYVLLDVAALGFPDDRACAGWLTREIGVTGVPASCFFHEPEHRYVRFHFAKQEATLRAAAERLATIPGRARP